MACAGRSVPELDYSSPVVGNDQLKLVTENLHQMKGNKRIYAASYTVQLSGVVTVSADEPSQPNP